MILTARVERIGDTQLYRIRINHDGPIVLDQESHTVCSRVAHLLCNPLAEIGTECAEVADSIRAAYEAQQEHERQDPHCTCPDCLDTHERTIRR